MATPAHLPSDQVTTPSQGTGGLTKPSINEHPLFTGRQTVGMISGENPRFDVEGQGGHEAMGEQLRALGLKFDDTHGRYGTPERSYIVYGPTREQMFDLGRRFGQESVVFSQGGRGRQEMLYCNGEKAGRFNPAFEDYEEFDEAPEDYYTWMPNEGKYLRLQFNWDALHPAPLQEPHASLALQTRAKSAPSSAPASVAAEPGPTEDALGKAEIALALALTLRKFIMGTPLRSPCPHPHSYPWHNGLTSMNLKSPGHGVLLRKGIDAATKPPVQDSPEHLANAPNMSDYARSALPFGHTQPGMPSSLNHYPLVGKGAQIEQLVRDHGYQIANYGHGHGRPNHAEQNYDTKHLPIHNSAHPDPQVQEYTDAWRKSHELAHALTHADVNQIYGEGRRVGDLGKHLTMRDALRAVHWEWLAAHKQRDLLRGAGIEIPDETFNRELNTVMHDAVHRVAGRRMIEPSGEGFIPHSHQVPLETTLGMVREAGHNLGLQGMHDLLTKSEGAAVADEKEFSVTEIRQELAKAVKERVREYEISLLTLRQRELAKAEKGCKCRGVCKCEGLEKATATGFQSPAGHEPKTQKAGHCHHCGENVVARRQILADQGQAEPVSHPEFCNSACLEAWADNRAKGGESRKPAPSKPAEKKPEARVEKAEKDGAPKSEDVTPKDHGSGGQKRKGRIPFGRKLAKGDFGMSDNGKVATSPAQAGGAKPAGAKPKFGLGDLAAGKQKLAAAGVKPASPLGMPKPTLPKPSAKPGEMAKPPAGVGHLNAPPKIGAAPKIPAAAAAPGSPAQPKPAPAAPPTPAAPGAPKPPAAPKAKPAGAPAMKSESESDDLKKNESSTGSTVAAIRERAKK